MAAESEIRQMSWISQISRGFPTFSLKVNFFKNTHTSFGLHVTLELKFVIVGNKKNTRGLVCLQELLISAPGFWLLIMSQSLIILLHSCRLYQQETWKVKKLLNSCLTTVKFNWSLKFLSSLPNKLLDLWSKIKT